MKRQLSMLFLLLGLAFTTLAQERTLEQALAIANAFITSPDNHLRSSSGLFIQEQDLANRQEAYYIFNRPDSQGFIVVSGSECGREVLGYTDTGRFDGDNLPPALQYWLSTYEAELSLLDEETMAGSYQVQTTTADLPATVAPLLQMEWNQNAPYNNQCPMVAGKRSVTGCNATAVAQIMKYHQYPQRGKGSNSVKADGTNYTVNFSAATYDWTKMLNSYKTTSSAEQQDEVAKLMYHVAVALNTEFGPSSGSNTQNTATGLVKYFNYDPNLQFYFREFYSDTQWEEMIRTELSQQRPVFYAGFGNDNEGGHAFVCDGYDANGFFHFNWGWGGTHNGYFALKALNPGAGGAGAGAGTYNKDQQIVMGIQPPTIASKPVYQLFVYESLTTQKTTTGRNETNGLTYDAIINMGVNAYEGTYGIALYHNSVMKRMLAQSNLSLKTFYALNGGATVGVPADLPDATYQLCLVHKASGSSKWEVIKGAPGLINHFLVKVAGNTITYTGSTETVTGLDAIDTTDDLNIAFDFFPNPAGEVITLLAANPLRQVSVYTLAGQLLFQRPVSETNQVSLEGLEKGLYIIEALDVTGLTHAKQLYKE